MRNARSPSVTAVLCTLVGLASVPLASPPVRADDAQTASGKTSPYRLILTTPASGDNWDGFRINKETGEVWNPSLINGGYVWAKMVDTDVLPSGDYDLQLCVIKSGNVEKSVVFRIDRKTGRSWKLAGKNWALINEPN